MKKSMPAESTSRKKMRPALTLEARENQMASYAMDLAEQQLLDGTASSQVITHFLKIGSTKERLEKEMMEQQKGLVNAKIENLQSAQRVEAVYEEALKAMRRYSGHGGDEDIEE